jgi:hypothetical protein
MSKVWFVTGSASVWDATSAKSCSHQTRINAAPFVDRRVWTAHWDSSVSAAFL